MSFILTLSSFKTEEIEKTKHSRNFEHNRNFDTAHELVDTDLKPKHEGVVYSSVSRDRADFLNEKKSEVYHCNFKTQPKSLRRPV